MLSHRAYHSGAQMDGSTHYDPTHPTTTTHPLSLEARLVSSAGCSWAQHNLAAVAVILWTHNGRGHMVAAQRGLAGENRQEEGRPATVEASWGRRWLPPRKRRRHPRRTQAQLPVEEDAGCISAELRFESLSVK